MAKVQSQWVTLDHVYFKISYDPKLRVPRYVKYVLTALDVKNKNAKRKNKFKIDPMLVNKNIPYVIPSEYAKSGYDKGHMAPSADFSRNQEANDLTFVMSNMMPQTPNLNRDSWRRLEDKVRGWACGEERIIVITGPVIEDSLPTLKSGLPIPKQFFKIVIDDTSPRKVIAFLYNQSDQGDVLENRIAKVTDIENKIHEHFESEVPVEDQGIFNEPGHLSEWASCKP